MAKSGGAKYIPMVKAKILRNTQNQVWLQPHSPTLSAPYDMCMLFNSCHVSPAFLYELHTILCVIIFNVLYYETNNKISVQTV